MKASKRRSKYEEKNKALNRKKGDRKKLKAKGMNAYENE